LGLKCNYKCSGVEGHLPAEEQQCDHGDRHWSEVAKNCWQLQWSGRSKEQILPQGLWRKPNPANALIFSPVKLISDF
jgi:hypothetical protein